MGVNLGLKEAETLRGRDKIAKKWRYYKVTGTGRSRQKCYNIAQYFAISQWKKVFVCTFKNDVLAGSQMLF